MSHVCEQWCAGSSRCRIATPTSCGIVQYLLIAFAGSHSVSQARAEAPHLSSLTSDERWRCRQTLSCTDSTALKMRRHWVSNITALSTSGKLLCLHAMAHVCVTAAADRGAPVHFSLEPGRPFDIQSSQGEIVCRQGDVQQVRTSLCLQDGTSVRSVEGGLTIMPVPGVEAIQRLPIHQPSASNSPFGADPPAEGCRPCDTRAAGPTAEQSGRGRGQRRDR